jgi:hypothetical protein
MTTQTILTDYYEVLHLHPDADHAMVDQSYWHLARLYNASMDSDPDAPGKLAQLNEAYSVLRSPALRQEYDFARERALRAGVLSSPPPPPRQVPLAVMAKQKPRPKKERAPDAARVAQPKPVAEAAVAVSDEEPPPVIKLALPRLPVSFLAFRVPPMQSAISALAILVLGAAALYYGAPTMLVVAMLLIGLVAATVPLVRIPSFPRPTVRLPSIGMPQPSAMGAGRPAAPAVDPMHIRQSTQQTIARFRAAHGSDRPGDPPRR